MTGAGNGSFLFEPHRCISGELLLHCYFTENTIQTWDYKTGNREGKILIKLFKLLEKDRKLAADCISQLYKSECTSVRIKAAAYSLSLGIDLPKAEEVLYIIGQDESLGIIGFNAEMTLKVWKKQGWLKIYPEQQIEQ